MRIWIALLIAPLLALTDLTVAYATVHWACAHQAQFVVHLVHVLFLAATAASTFAVWSVWRAAPAVEGSAQTHFLAGVATASAALSTAAIAAMWMPTWMIASCLS
jgi:hypothetical protein